MENEPNEYAAFCRNLFDLPNATGEMKTNYNNTKHQFTSFIGPYISIDIG